MNHAAMLVLPLEMGVVENYVGFGLSGGPEDSTRDKIENRLGALWGLMVCSGEINFNENEMKGFLLNNVCAE